MSAEILETKSNQELNLILHTSEVPKGVGGTAIGGEFIAVIEEDDVSRLELRASVADFLSENLGQPVGATRLLETVLGDEYDPSQRVWRNRRMYVHNMFNKNQAVYRTFNEEMSELGLVFQAGTMHITRTLREDAKPLKKRMYRAFREEDYIPSAHESRYITRTSYIDWESADFDDERIIPRFQRPINELGIAEAPRTRVRRRKSSDTTKKSTRFVRETDDTWLDDIKRDVAYELELMEQDGLISGEPMSISKLRILSSSPLLGTRTNRERLFSAGIFNRSALEDDFTVSTSDIVKMKMFNRWRKELGQRGGKQKQALETIEAEVAEILSQISK